LSAIGKGTFWPVRLSKAGNRHRDLFVKVSFESQNQQLLEENLGPIAQPKTLCRYYVYKLIAL